jgi:hypothetical protein
MFFVLFAQFSSKVFVDIVRTRVYSNVIKGKEHKKMFDDSLYELYVNYDRYVRKQEAKNEKPVSFLKYAFGNY